MALACERSGKMARKKYIPISAPFSFDFISPSDCRVAKTASRFYSSSSISPRSPFIHTYPGRDRKGNNPTYTCSRHDNIEPEARLGSGLR